MEGTPDPQQPRRGNGLPASTWVRLADVDPRLGAHLLDVLGVAGIAAYVAPVPGAVGSYLEVRLPDRPTDRVYVDPQRLDDARALVSDALAEHERADAVDAAPTGPSVSGAAPVEGVRPSPGVPTDDEWAAIVAAFDASPSGPVGPWPAQEDRDPGDDAPESDEAPAAVARRRRRTDPVDPDEEAGHDPADDDHYVPPPPPPVPRAHPAFWGGVLSMVLGAVLMFRPDVVLGSPSSTGTLATGVLLVAVGFGILVWRLHDGPPTDSGPDDGAVV